MRVPSASSEAKDKISFLQEKSSPKGWLVRLSAAEGYSSVEFSCHVLSECHAVPCLYSAQYSRTTAQQDAVDDVSLSTNSDCCIVGIVMLSCFNVFVNAFIDTCDRNRITVPFYF